MSSAISAIATVTYSGTATSVALESIV